MHHYYHYYILENGVPKGVDDSREWARWYETGNRIVQQTHVGDLFISTVFLSLNHAFSGEGEPILYETMVFLGNGDSESLGEDTYTERYSLPVEAEAGHARIVAICQQKQAEAERITVAAIRDALDRESPP